MSSRPLFWLLITVLLTTSPAAEAQQPKKVPNIGYLTSSGRASFEAFATALRQLGYVEGKSVIFEFRTSREYGSTAAQTRGRADSAES